MAALLESRPPGDTLVTRLRADATLYMWVGATIGSSTAARYQLASGHPVLALGGFNGTGPAPTLAQFQEHVQRRRIHYLLADPVRSSATEASTEPRPSNTGSTRPSHHHPR